MVEKGGGFRPERGCADRGQAAAGAGGFAAARAAGGGRTGACWWRRRWRSPGPAPVAPPLRPSGLAVGSVRSDGAAAPAEPGVLAAAALAAAGRALRLRRQPRGRRRGTRGPRTPGPRAGGCGHRRGGAAPRFLLRHVRGGVLRPALLVRGR